MRAWCVWLAAWLGAAWLGVACGGGSSPMCTGPDCACLAGTAKWCGGVCTDVQTDPASCGSCGHDCEGAPCFDGGCLPERLAVVPNRPAGIALDGDTIVFATGGAVTSSGAVYRVPKAGGPVEVVYRGLGAAPALAVTEGTIFVADSGQVIGCRTYSSAGAILAISGGSAALHAGSRRCARSLVPTDDGLTWIEESPLGAADPDVPDPWIAHLPEGSPPDAPPAVLHDRREGLAELVRTGAALTWREGAPPSIVEMPAGGGAAIRILDQPGGTIEAYTIDAERVVYARSDDLSASVVVRSRSIGEEVIVARDAGHITRLAADASFAYWINEWFDGGGVWAVDLRTASRRLLAAGTAHELAQDDRFLYVLRSIERATGLQTEVLRIRKPAGISPSFRPTDDCRAPLAECSLDPFFTTCVDLASDARHCGDCAIACGAGEICVGGACTCAESSLTCGGRCVDPGTDAAHCGRCGRSCAGGECVGGDCRPVKIGEPTWAAVHDASAVYYMRGDFVKRLDKQSGVITTIAQVFPFGDPGPLAVDASRIYVSGESVIWARAKDGSGPQTAIYTGRVDARQLAVAGDTLVWVESSGTFAPKPVKLFYGAATGGFIKGAFVPQNLYPGAQDDDSRDLVLAGSTAYWLLGDTMEGRGRIVQIDLAAAVPTLTLLATIDHDPESLAVHGDRLYLTTRGSDGVLLSMPITGGPTTIHARGLVRAGPVELASDGSIFWVDGDPEHRLVRQLAPGWPAPRVVQIAPSWEQAAPSISTVLLVDQDRLYTAAYDFDAGLSVMIR